MEFLTLQCIALQSMFRDFNADTIDTSDIQGEFHSPFLTNQRPVFWSHDLCWQSQASVQVTSSHTGLYQCYPDSVYLGAVTAGQ